MIDCPLVSLVTPCYNVENKVQIYLDSVLEQTYTNIELILVDDGSTDKTHDIIDEYIPEFEKRKINVKYIHQENTGAAGALQNGLNYVCGEYLMWPDADDFLTPDSISLKVEYLENHKEFAMVRSNAYVVNENTPDDRSHLIVSYKNLKRTFIYNECIRFKTFYCPGCYMVRWSSFLQANPEKYIYKTYYGQNIQMLIPLAYRFRCGHIDKPLYGYMIYNDSHSRLGGNRNYERSKDYSINVEKIILNTMEATGVKRENDFSNVKNDFCMRRMKLAYTEGNSTDKINEYNKMTGIRKYCLHAVALRFFPKSSVTDNLLKFFQLFDIAVFKLLNRR